MYTWVSSKPYVHHERWRVWFKNIDGKKSYETFDSEDAAVVFITKAAKRKLVGGGHPVGAVVEEYLGQRRLELKPGSMNTLRYRLGAVMEGRRQIPIEAFPWAKAWTEHVSIQSTDSQYGIKSALQGLTAWCQKQSILRRSPISELPIHGRKKRGKSQLRLDEARRFVATALDAGDPLAVAAALLVLTGLRPGEAMALQVRDSDDGGAVLWVEKGKTEAARRAFEVAEELRPYLLALTRGRVSTEYLFVFEPTRDRATLNLSKRRTDALLRRVRALCDQAAVPRVVSHSMRGLHSTLAVGFGTTSHAVAKQLGHTSFVVTKRHYLAPGAEDKAELRRNLLVLRGNHRSKSVTGGKEAA